MSVLLLSSCASYEKKLYKTTKFLNENPEAAAKYCASNFTSEPQYIKGDTKVVFDTVEIKGDSIPCPESINPKTGEKEIVFVKCPDHKTVSKSESRIDTIYKDKPETVAKLEVQRFELEKSVKTIVVLEDKLAESKAAHKEAESKARKRLWIILGMGAGVIGYLLIKFKVL